MVDGAVVPDGEVVEVLPAVADLEVVVLDDEVDEPVEEVARLVVGEALDALDVVADGEDALPARHGVRADDGVVRLEGFPYVLGGPAHAGEDLEAVVRGRLVEDGLRAVRGQALEELLHRGREAVVDFVAGGPEGV